MSKQEWWEMAFDEQYRSLYTWQNELTELQVQFAASFCEEGGSILDIACGDGRHTTALAEMGFVAVGVDYSQDMLLAADPHSKAILLQEDMRYLPFVSTFDLVVNLFTSFGYFHEESDNQKALEEFYRVTSPGGVCVIDLLNPQMVRDQIDANTKRWRKEQEGYVHDVRMFEKAEMIDLLQEVGFHVHAVYGGYEKQPFTKASHRMIFHCQKIS